MINNRRGARLMKPAEQAIAAGRPFPRPVTRRAVQAVTLVEAPKLSDDEFEEVFHNGSLTDKRTLDANMADWGFDIVEGGPANTYCCVVPNREGSYFCVFTRVEGHTLYIGASLKPLEENGGVPDYEGEFPGSIGPNHDRFISNMRQYAVGAVETLKKLGGMI